MIEEIVAEAEVNKVYKGKVKSILELVYGVNWKLPILLRYRQLILNNNTNRRIEEEIDDIESIIGKMEVDVGGG